MSPGGRYISRMAKTRKKSGPRARKAGAAGGSRWGRRAWRFALLCGGVLLGLMVPWAMYLNHQVTTEFEGRKWELPSRVFARALDLYPGLELGLQDLQTELAAAGYRRADPPARDLANRAC